MVDNITLAERKFEEFLPILKEKYPTKRKNKSDLVRFIDAYRDISFSDNVVIAMYDHRTASLFYISENIENLSGGYASQKILKWGGLLLFKALHYTHYSYVYKAIKWDFKFSKGLSKSELLNSRSYFSGLKLVDAKRKIRQVFLKGRRLKIDEQNQSDVTIFFIEEVTHLVKGDHYWMRHANDNKTLAYVNQSGKKEFRDVISESEKPVLKLLAEKKSTAEIAALLHLSKLTVQTHRKNMIKRVGAVDSTALVHLCKMANVI